METTQEQGKAHSVAGKASDTGTPVIEDYATKMPLKFTGTLNKVTIDLK